MHIEKMFKSDINREINGVVKVAQDDEKVIEQELREYIITRELRGHFATFFNHYSESIHQPTDKIGVWFSGFFGSGKSHFLKMLSYLLENRIVAGKPAVEYFRDKFEDPMMFSMVEQSTAIPTETILFNIDSKSPINKDKTAILRVFAKVFYEHQGFYGNDLKVAKLEQYITRSGKMEAFQEIFLQRNGQTWESARDAFAFFEDDIVQALIQTLGMSETAAGNWFNGEESADMSIGQLVDEIKAYVESKDPRFRLLFMIDEVGQYIGADSDLMLNLQTIVEDLGTACHGQVWVMVTSQEAIDSITKLIGNDFSKIQGRFNTRLSLSSSSVDEVIKKRLLAKDDHAAQLLNLSYGKNNAVLKNLLIFNDSVLDLKGYSSETDYVETYPFVPYQFRLMQNVLAQIRKHGNTGRHLSGGERSMLSGFQEAAQAIQEKDENALVPFHLFYDTVHTFLESAIRRVIDRCATAAENNQGVEPEDVKVLKLLYLIRYVDDIKANIDNIATLMVEDVRTDKISLRKNIAASLDRLLSQNYIARYGDQYLFLTDDEQDIAREIRNTTVDSSFITQGLSQILFGELYPAKKFRYRKYDFAFDQMVDDQVAGTLTGAMRLRFITVASDLYNSGDQRLIHTSSTNNEAILVLSDQHPYFEELESAMKIRKYVKQRNVAQLPEAIQNIIRGRQQQAKAHEDRAKEYLDKAILTADYYAQGEKLTITKGSAKERIDETLTALVESLYSKLTYVRQHAESDADILTILKGGDGQQAMAEAQNPNLEALRELEQYLDLQHIKHLPTSMGDIHKRFSAIPYGWREVDIAALVAGLAADQKITIHYGGSTIPTTDKKLPDYLRRRNEIDKTIIKRRVATSETLMKDARDFLREYLGVMDVPQDEDGLINFTVTRLEAKHQHHKDLLEAAYKDNTYPDKQTVEEGAALLDEILQQKRDNTALLTKLLEKQDHLMDLEEDMQDVTTFFTSQRPIFDKAQALKQRLVGETDYFAAADKVQEDLKQITAILVMGKPYEQISRLPELMQGIDAAYGQLLQDKKEEVLGIIQQAMGDVHTLAGSSPKVKEGVQKAGRYFTDKKEKCAEAEALLPLDAMITQVLSYKDQVCRHMEMVLNEGEVTPGKQIKSVRRYDVFTAKRLEKEEDVDEYTENIRAKLKEMLKDCDGIQLQ